MSPAPLSCPPPALSEAGRGGHSHARAVLWLLLAPIVWGLSFPLVKALAMVHVGLRPGDTPWLVTCCLAAPRFLFAGLLLLAWCGRGMLGTTRSEWVQGAGLGLFCGVGFLFQVDGLQHTSASVSAFLTQLYAVLIPVWTALRTRRRPSWAVLVACGLVVIGGGILADVNPADIGLGRGEAETLLASVFFMVEILWLVRPAFAGNDPLRITTLMFLFQGVGFSVAVLGDRAGSGGPRDAGGQPLLVGHDPRADGCLHALLLRGDEHLAAAGHADRGRGDLLRRAGVGLDLRALPARVPVVVGRHRVRGRARDLAPARRRCAGHGSQRAGAVEAGGGGGGIYGVKVVTVAWNVSRGQGREARDAR